jgi:hypothetical protein
MRAKPWAQAARTLYRLLDALALSIVLVVDGAKAERVQPHWRLRNETKVTQRAMSPVTISRARPHILAELARRAARPRWRDMPARDFIQAMVGDDA